MEGAGIHTGKKAVIKLFPAPAFTGIVFIRVDLEGKPVIPVTAENVKFQVRRTSIGVDNAEVHTVEHFLAALYGLGIDNLRVEVNGPEIPAGDGSAAWFLERLKKAEIQTLDYDRPLFALPAPIAIQEGDSSICAIPYDKGLRLSYTLDYSSFGLLPQYVSFNYSQEAFEKSLGGARTFCFKQEVERLRNDEGLGQGASYENTLVIENGQPIQNSFRFPDELARHKMLDLLGDLSMLSFDLCASIVAVKSGHYLNSKLAARLKEVYSAQESQKLGFDIKQIQNILPHRYPFLLVDRVVEFEPGKRIVGIKNVTMNEEFFQGHFPGQPVMPGVLQVEAMAQVGGLLMLKELKASGRIAYLSTVRDMKFRKPVVPGDQLRIEVRAVKLKKRFGQVTARATVDGKPVAEGDINFALVDNEEQDQEQ